MRTCANHWCGEAKVFIAADWRGKGRPILEVCHEKAACPGAGAGGMEAAAGGGKSEIPVVLVEFTDADGEELDAGGDVFLVAALDGLVDVAGGD